MRRLLAFAILGLAFSGIAVSAPPVMDPELDYIATPDATFVDRGISRSGVILRLELDLEGSGKKSVFLIYQGSADRSGRMWTAYLARDTKGYDRATNGVQFRDDFFVAGKLPKLNPTGGVIGLWPAKIDEENPKGGAVLFRYRLIDQDLKFQEFRDLDYGKPADLGLFAKLFGGSPSGVEPHARAEKNRELFKKVTVAEVEARRDAAKHAPKPAP